jgi:hypothetical protein
MKKRKKPIFLIAFLVLLVTVVTAMNANILSTAKAASGDDPAPDPAVTATDNSQPAKSAKPVAQTDTKSLLSPDAGVNDDPPMNVKPVDAIPSDGPKILAPQGVHYRKKAPDRASTLPNSGWYMDESGANGTHNSSSKGN